MAMDLALADVMHEMAGTRRVLERLPDESFDWKPHELSWSVGHLATHLVNLIGWQRGILEQDEYDLAGGPPRREALTSRAAVLAEWDAQAPELEASLARMDDAALAATWTLRNGEHVIFSQPRLTAYRTFGVSHMVHHRAQLGVYLRQLGVPVPGLYGPSADERR